MSDEVVLLNFSLSIPPEKWLAKFSMSYPHLQFIMLSMLPFSENQGNALLQIKGPNLTQFWDEFKKFNEKKRNEMIFRDKNSILLNILMSDPWVLQTILDAQLLLRFPIIIQNGKISIELIGSRNKIDQLFNHKNWKKADIAIKQIKKYCPNSLLTPRQLEILNKALINGFFDIPRKKSLSIMAKEIGISPSALSENIRRINKKLAEHYISCLDLPN
ncbi:MAG: helix-turn-helix domain-containing protein [Promethearchaeota archaeon]